MAYYPTQARRIADGLCMTCGATRGENGTTVNCRPCADKNTARSLASKARQRERWAADDLACNGCGAQMAASMFKTCEKCRQRSLERLNRFLGPVGTRAPRAPRKLTAQELARRNETAQIRKGRKAAAGICFSCRQPTTHASRYCRDHWLRNSLGKYGFKRSQYGVMWARLEAQGFRCYYTGVELVPGVNVSLDHRIPRSRGGALLDPENCVWCDRLINAFKNDLTEAEFVERCKAVVDRLG